MTDRNVMPSSMSAETAERKVLNIISLGAGVQSSTMALMAAHGEITPMPDCAIFADTQAEPKAVYTWLDWMEKQLPFPVHRVTAGSLFKRIMGTDGYRNGKQRAVDIPAYLGWEGKAQGFINRHCTKYFKITPIRRKVRELAGLTRKRSPAHPVVTQWIGISLDEAHRMKPAREPWVVHRWPLVDMRMARSGCLNWMRSHGYPEPAKSACVFCPYHRDDEWRGLQSGEFADAVKVDQFIRNARDGQLVKAELFLHRSLKPLDEVDFRTAEDHGQLDMFGNECEGMCGV